MATWLQCTLCASRAGLLFLLLGAWRAGVVGAAAEPTCTTGAAADPTVEAPSSSSPLQLLAEGAPNHERAIGHDHLMLQLSHATGASKLPPAPSPLAPAGLLQTAAEDNASARQSCCDKCTGRPFCSPKSGNCYDTKRKDYYQSCGGGGGGGGGGSSLTCCGSCSGNPVCSPLSSNCYHAKSKPYYMHCSDAANPNGFDLKACTGPGKMRVKVLTYNLFWWNLFGKRGGNGGSAGRLVRNAGQGEPFDVVGFQECDDPNWIMGDAGMHGEYDYVRWGSNTIAFRKTRWEKLANGHTFTAEDRQDQYYGRRGAQWARLRDTRTGATLFFAHTHGPLPVDSGGRFGGEAAAWGLLGVVYRFAQKGDSIVLTGDFNAQAWSGTVRLLDSRIHRIMTQWVDHIYTNCAGARVVETRNLGKGGSDHDALMAIINF